jgi:hypothetical protein
VLLFQLSTILLVIAGPLPPRHPWPEFHKSAIERSVRP